MKQTNVLNSKTVLIIGSGRLAKHLHYWNSLQAKPNHIIKWNRSENPGLLSEFLQQADLVWLAISDSALQTFFENHLLASAKPVVHFSGAFSDNRMKCAHPLMSFPNELLPDATYMATWFAISETDTLNEMLPGFSNASFAVSAKMKPLYHALCVVAGNFPQLLWNEVDYSRKQLNIPEAAFSIYLQQTLDNFLNLKSKALTGPLIRHDQNTMDKNRTALVNTKLHSIYAAFMKEFSP